LKCCGESPFFLLGLWGKSRQEHLSQRQAKDTVSLTLATPFKKFPCNHSFPALKLHPTAEIREDFVFSGRRRQGAFRGDLAPPRSTPLAPHCPGGGGCRARRCRSAPAASLRRAGRRALARAHRPAAAAAAATEAARGRADRELQMAPTPECGAPSPWCVSPAPREWRLNEERGKGKAEALLAAEPPARSQAVGHIAGAPAGELAGGHRSPHSLPRRGE